jgi:hypothetical protein
MKFYGTLVAFVLIILLQAPVAYGGVSIKDALEDSGVSEDLLNATQTNRDQSNTFGYLPTLDTDLDKDPVQLVETVLVNFVINPIFFISAGVAIFMIIWAAKSLLLGTVMEDEIAKAKKTLIWALAGLALITFSYTLVRNLTFQISCLLTDDVSCTEQVAAPDAEAATGGAAGAAVP